MNEDLPIKDIRACKMANDGCKAPAGYGVGNGGWFPGEVSCRGTCVHCEEPVCSSNDCSRRIRGKGRYCRDCDPGRD